MSSTVDLQVPACLSCIYSRVHLEEALGPCSASIVKFGCRYVRARHEEGLQWSVSDEDLVPYANGEGASLSQMQRVSLVIHNRRQQTPKGRHVFILPRVHFFKNNFPKNEEWPNR